MNAAYIFLVVLGFVTILHIAVIILNKETLRQVSKCVLVPILIAVYIAGGGTALFFPLLALILGWIGDVLLLKIHKKTNFMLGLVSFLLGHICYIVAFIQILGSFGTGGVVLNIPAIVIFTPPAIVLGMVVFRLIKPTKDMRIPVIVYMAVLVTLTLFGFQVFLLNPGSISGLLVLSGCLCFMISDTILAYYTFRKLKISGSVLIMAYYILAQAEIIMGILLLR